MIQVGDESKEQNMSINDSENDSAFLKFMEIVKRRRAVRHFLTEPIPEAVLLQCLEAARWAPSGYNLQPTHFTVVQDAAVKEKLCYACFNQRQILDAPVIVVFTADRQVYQNQMKKILAMDEQAGAINSSYREFLERTIQLAFSRGPLGIGWLWKRCCELFLGGYRPVPRFPATHLDYWLAKQTMLSAMNFMLAATAAGLGTCPMEGFGESQVQQVLNLPNQHLVVLVVPIGYIKGPGGTRTRLELSESLHWNAWPS